MKAVPASNDRQKTLALMKKIDFRNMNISDRALSLSIVKLLKSTLQFNATKRIQTADQMMFACYEILKKYDIRYARHAIKKFIVDKGLVRGPFVGNDQNIYFGSVL